MKTLAKTKKTTSTSKFDKWLYSFELPDWVKRRIIAPILVISIFLLGAFFQFNYPFFSAQPKVVNYHAAKLTAAEQWRIDHYTCDSMFKLQAILESESANAEDTLALARTEQKATGLILANWSTYVAGKKLDDDWHENATTIWSRVITLSENWPHRNEPWAAKAYPRLAAIDTFQQYLGIGIEEPDPNRMSDWMIVLKRCTYAPAEPAQTPIVVAESSDQSLYCPIYARLQKLNFDDPQSIAIFAQNNLRIVNQKGSQIDNWSQVEISLSTLLSTLTDAQISIPSTAAYQAYLELPPLQVLTHRLDLLCGA
jgi:hypothetical protein